MAIDTQTETGDAVERLLEDVRAAIATGDSQRAYEISNRAISRGQRHSTFFAVRARRSEERGYIEFALEDYERAVEFAPQDPAIYDSFALCALRTGAFARAIAALNVALSAKPDNPLLLYRRGLAFAHSDDFRSAERDYEAALALDPEYVDALASLALVKARRSEAAHAREFAAKALALAPRHVTASMALVQADLSENKYADAEKRAVELLDGNVLPLEALPTALAMLGDALDGQKRFAEAFAAYSRQNEALRRLFAPQYSGSPGGDAARHLVGYFENESLHRWRAPDDGGNAQGDIAGHVFLLGFMRSGTTLLEQVLTGDPKIAVLEEKALLAAAGEKYMTSIPALETLARLEGKDLARQRELYWQAVREHVPDVAGKIILDKQPLNTTKLPLIAKLFPNARILLALRDPRDVVLSCYRRNLKVTASQFDFLSLDSCARFYASVMRLGEISRQLLVLELLEHRYEAMVEDFEGRVRAVCTFVGIEWSESLRNFDKRAPVAQLLSPSAAQIRRPLYGEGVGQWRRYADQLAPVLPILEPWVEKFGYPKD